MSAKEKFPPDNIQKGKSVSTMFYMSHLYFYSILIEFAGFITDALYAL